MKVYFDTMYTYMYSILVTVPNTAILKEEVQYWTKLTKIIYSDLFLKNV